MSDQTWQDQASYCDECARRAADRGDEIQARIQRRRAEYVREIKATVDY